MVNKASNQPVEPVPRLIVGMSRAATTWLCKCLNEHTQACAFGESLFWGRRFVEPAAGGRYDAQQVEALRRRLRDGGSVYPFVGSGPGTLKRITLENFPSTVDSAFRELPAKPTPGEVFVKFTRMVACAEGKQCAVEKTPHHVNWMDRILRELPDARFVVMVREPYGFMLSSKHFGDEKNPAMRRRFRRRYHPLGNALVWRGYMRAALAASDRWPRQTLLMRYDEIERDPAAVLARVQEFFGLRIEDLAARVPRDNTSFIERSRPELRGDDMFWMNLVAGRVMKRSGFQTRRFRLDPIRVSWSMARLPWWALSNAISFRRMLSGSSMSYFWRWLRPSSGASGSATEAAR